MSIGAQPILNLLLQKHKEDATAGYKDLSLKGRPLPTKAECLSRLAYAAQSLFVDKSTCKTMNVLIQFLWKN